MTERGFEKLVSEFLFGNMEFEQMRDLLVQYENQDIRCFELAENLNCTPGSVRTRILRALNDLKVVYNTLENKLAYEEYN